jgi:hypothetical protein
VAEQFWNAMAGSAQSLVWNEFFNACPESGHPFPEIARRFWHENKFFFLA